MDCAEVAAKIVEYHFARLESDGDRDAVEGHLVACTACLKTYLALKRATESSVADKPSPEVKARLRAEIARTFVKRPAASRPALFARRIPLYQGVVAAALAAAIALAAPAILRRVVARDVGSGTPAVDTSRAQAESFQIY